MVIAPNLAALSWISFVVASCVVPPTGSPTGPPTSPCPVEVVLIARCWRSAVLLLALAIVATMLPVGATAQQAEQRRLDQARSALARIATEIDAAEGAADAADAALDDAIATMREIEAVVNEVAADVERQRDAVRDAARRLEVVEADQEVLAAAFADRITRLYKQGPTATLEMLLASQAAEDAFARGTMLTRLTEGDQVDLERLAAAEVAVAAERGRLQIEQELLEGLLVEQQELLAEATQLRERRALVAAEAREQVADLERQHDDLEDEQERLEELIRQRQEEERQRRAAAREAEKRREAERAAAAAAAARAPSSTPRASSSSGFAWPICARVTSEYGPRWGRMHRGIDQGAATGTSIGASKAGTVIFANWQGGYGRLVLVDHHDGVVTAYAHMSAFSVGAGTSVSQGQTLGKVGSTGNSTGPHLHFETRVNGTAVNPRQYLSGSPC